MNFFNIPFFIIDFKNISQTVVPFSKSFHLEIKTNSLLVRVEPVLRLRIVSLIRFSHLIRVSHEILFGVESVEIWIASVLLGIGTMFFFPVP